MSGGLDSTVALWWARARGYACEAITFRYGQRHTAQVYNPVLSDTIERKIFLLLNDKLTEIAKALGKVDEHGEVAEDPSPIDGAQSEGQMQQIDDLFWSTWVG